MPSDDPARNLGPLADVPVPDPSGRSTVYLLAGQVHATARPTAITTVLGSCISVCLYDPEAAVGGMNHFLLPTPVSRDHSARFGNVAMEALRESVLRQGARAGALRAKIFGGAAVLGTRPTGRRHLGEENTRVALAMLDDMAIPVVDGDVGGTRGRKVVFHTDDGSAWMRTL